GLEETELEPEPVRLTVSRRFSSAKEALTLFAALIVTTHFLPPSSSDSQPVQPLNSEPAVAVSVRMTTAPWPNLAEHVPPPVWGVGELVIWPEPVMLTVSRRFSSAKEALTLFAALIVTTHFLPPSSSDSQPVQPLNSEPEEAVALSVTVVPK